MVTGCLGIFLRLLANAIALRVANGIVDRMVNGVGAKLPGIVMGFLTTVSALVGVRLKR